MPIYMLEVRRRGLGLLPAVGIDPFAKEGTPAPAPSRSGITRRTNFAMQIPQTSRFSVSEGGRREKVDTTGGRAPPVEEDLVLSDENGEASADDVAEDLITSPFVMYGGPIAGAAGLVLGFGLVWLLK